ncbi:hypothetical protein B0T18DRAFT_95570 [Schizothecium vesticola]|uniref:Uncharacterized protein n=1 Tax=Schizothecium vesticola TaxID=314040 RepID=A0AA40K7N2_9PEZI|nr:hypothetical protein B0T18DRAFT_95570 [Schizothecium vesticola]
MEPTGPLGTEATPRPNLLSTPQPTPPATGSRFYKQAIQSGIQQPRSRAVMDALIHATLLYRSATCLLNPTLAKHRTCLGRGLLRLPLVFSSQVEY